MDISVTSFALGAIAGLAVIGLLLPSFDRRLHGPCRLRLAEVEDALRESRRERVDDRETNRRLRRELAVRTPANFETTLQERDRAIGELEKLSAELRATSDELADRDRSLRQARLAIQDIRAHLERGRLTSVDRGSARGGTDPGDARVSPPGEIAAVGFDGAAPVDLDGVDDLDETPA